MKIIVNKNSLVQAIVESLAEEEEPEFERIGLVDDMPVIPTSMMATQLAEEMPPVEDPEFIPATIDELTRSAQVIANEVPPDQIEFFYRKLHHLLDLSLDKEAEREVQTESVRVIISSIMNEASDLKKALLKKAVARLETEDAYDISVEYIENYPEFEDSDPEDLANKIQMMSYGIEDDTPEESEPETPIVDLTHDEPYVSPHAASDDDSESREESDDEQEYPDDDYDSDLARETSEETSESIAADIVGLIMKKDLHTAVLKDPETGESQMVPVVIIDPNTGDFKMSEKEMRVLASESYGFEIIRNALGMSDISTLFSKLVEKAGSDKAAYLWLYSNLSEVLGKEGNPVSSELGAEMYANQIADTIGKYGEAVKEQLLAMADQVETKTEDIAIEIGRGTDSLSIVVPPDEMAAALRMVADQRLDVPKRGRPRLYDEDEPREAMTSEMRKQIRAERRKAELELEYEPGKMHLSPKALRAMMDDIATSLGVSLGNVRNIIYDDLKVYGLPAEDLRKMLDIDIPGGREKIPFTYDPLRVQAKERIVEKLYDMYTGAMKSYIQEVIDDGDDDDQDVGRSYMDLFFADDGLYQPGLDGYVRLQSQVGGPTVDDPDSVDINDSAFRVKRKAYDFVQEFIDQVAKEWLDPESPEYRQAKEGGMRAFLNSMVNDRVFSDVSSRADMEKIIKDETDGIENMFNEEKLKSIIDIVFDKAPRRTKKYIARIKKELGTT